MKSNHNYFQDALEKANEQYEKHNPKKKPVKRERSKLELRLETQLVHGKGLVKDVDFVCEHRFHSVRQWRLDFAFPKHKVAVEIQGGIYSNGSHVRGAFLETEYEKLNTATALGWRVLLVTDKQIKRCEVLGWLESMGVI